jgi:DNA-binding NarL/FixJ family response regulator
MRVVWFGSRSPRNCKPSFTMGVVDDVYGLGDIADEIDDLRGQLEDAYGSRVEAILQAMADGHSLREIAEHLRMSHTAVAKALDGVVRADS